MHPLRLENPENPRDFPIDDGSAFKLHLLSLDSE